MCYRYESGNDISDKRIGGSPNQKKINNEKINNPDRSVGVNCLLRYISKLNELFCNSVCGCFFLFIEMIKLHGEEHYEKDDGYNDYKAPVMMSERLLENIKRITRLCLTEKHIIRSKLIVEKVKRDRHTEKEHKTAGNVPRPRLDVAACRQHNRVERQQNVDAEAVHVHKIQEWQLGPGGEEKSDCRGGNTDGVEKIVDGL